MPRRCTTTPRALPLPLRLPLPLLLPLSLRPNPNQVHNHNSSRFGKWCAVHFDGATGRIASATVDSFLLEPG